MLEKIGLDVVVLDFCLAHLVVFLPVGVFRGVECERQQGKGGEHLIDFTLENVKASCVEHPVALAVAGVDARVYSGGVFGEAVLYGILHLLHQRGGVEVGHTGFVGLVGPCHLYSVDVFFRVAHIVQAAAACHHDEVAVFRFCGCGPPVGGNVEFCHNE